MRCISSLYSIPFLFFFLPFPPLLSSLFFLLSSFLPLFSFPSFLSAPPLSSDLLLIPPSLLLQSPPLSFHSPFLSSFYSPVFLLSSSFLSLPLNFKILFFNPSKANTQNTMHNLYEFTSVWLVASCLYYSIKVFSVCLCQCGFGAMFVIINF